MVKIQVLGPGCQKCKALFEQADQAARELGLDYEIVKVDDLDVIIGYGVMSTPALIVDGRLKFSGRVPTTAQLKEMLA